MFNFCYPKRTKTLDKREGLEMKDDFYIGNSPPDEDCVQLGLDNYLKLAREECERYIACLEHYLGKPPEGSYFFIKSCPHDFGTYLSVFFSFDDKDEKAIDYMFRCESDGPSTWLEGEARSELGPDSDD